MGIQLRVPDASCGHCKAAIEQAVTGVDGVDGAELDLDSKVLSVSGGGDIDAQGISRAIEEAGYTPEVA